MIHHEHFEVFSKEKRWTKLVVGKNTFKVVKLYDYIQSYEPQLPVKWSRMDIVKKINHDGSISGTIKNYETGIVVRISHPT